MISETFQHVKADVNRSMNHSNKLTQGQTNEYNYRCKIFHKLLSVKRKAERIRQQSGTFRGELTELCGRG